MSGTPKCWEDQGCKDCRTRILGAEHLAVRFGTSFKHHVQLARCGVCGAYWGIFTRYASEITQQEAEDIMADADWHPHQ